MPGYRYLNTSQSMPEHRTPRPAVVLLTAAVISLLVHGALGSAIYERPIGYIDTNRLRGEEVVTRVTPYDPVDRMLDDSLVRPPDPSEAASLDRLSEALLAEHDRFAPEAPTAAVELRDVAEADPAEAALASKQLEATRGLDPVEAYLVEAGAPPPPAREGVGDAPAGASSGALAATDSTAVADSLLASVLPMARTPRRELEPSRPEPLDRPVLDRRSLQPDAQPLEPDFATLALSGTTRIEIPEHLDDDFDYHVRTYVHDPRFGAAERGYFEVEIVPRRSLRRLAAMPKDVVFLIDTSGSVPQTWVDKVVRGVSASLETLNEGDRFNIVLFSDKPAFLSTTGPIEASPDAVRTGQRFLRDAESEGYTDVNRALSRLLVRDQRRERVYNLVLISDGRPTRGVLDTRELINMITRDNDLTASIYCVGVGSRQNEELLEFLAYRNKGFCVFVDHIDRTEQTIRGLLSRIRFPILQDVSVHFVGLERDDVVPRVLPNIHQSEAFHVYGRFDERKPFTMRLVGFNHGRPMDFTFTRDLNKAGRGERGIRESWAFWKLHHLYSELLLRGDRPELREQIDQLRRRYDLKTLY